METLPDGVLRRVLADVPRWRVQYAQLGDDGEQSQTHFVPAPPPGLVCAAFRRSAPEPAARRRPANLSPASCL